jgi:hypothetical protein
MSGRSPASVLFTVSGQQVGVYDGQPASTSGLQGLIATGSDGLALHHLRVDSTGALRIDPIGTTAQPVTDNGGSITIDDGGTSLTVDGPLTDAELRASAVPISVASLPLPAGAATEATLTLIKTKTDNLDIALSTRATEATALTLLTEAEFEARVGEVQASPTANTILGRLKALYDAIIARLGTLGQKTMSASTPVVIASDQSAVNMQLTDSSGTKLGVDDAVTIPAGTDGILAMGTDYDGIARRMRTTADGRLVVNSAVSAPPNNTAVSNGYSGNVSTETNNFYTIPNGEQLKIQRFAGGGEASTGGSKIELWWAPNGNTTDIELIRVGYVASNNFEFTLDWDAPALGNGTRAIMVRRERFDGGAIELAGFWDGYY